MIAGLFGVGGALVGGLISFAAARVDRKWNRAERDIKRLCAQVMAYHRLEQLYAEELANLQDRKEKLIKEDMRSRVAAEGYERPSMTSTAAEAIRREWGD